MAAAVIPPMPTRLPSFRDQDAPTGPPTCLLHGPTSPYTRNTRGEYSSHAPACCGPDGGCYIGRQEELETLVANQLTAMTDTLGRHLVTGPPDSTCHTLAETIDRHVHLLQRTAPGSFQTQIHEADMILSLLGVLIEIQQTTEPVRLAELIQEAMVFEEAAGLEEPTYVRQQAEPHSTG